MNRYLSIDSIPEQLKNHIDPFVTMNKTRIKRSHSPFLSRNGHWITLVLILAFGLFLRSYHLDYPVVGYHNWKETHYLTEARNFARDGFFSHGFFVPASDYPELYADPSGAHSDTFPTTSIVTALVFRVVGYELWAARLISVLFMIGSIFIFYLVVKKLFNRKDLALVSASVMAIMPLLVFFGRQAQLINPAMFFTLLGLYFYLRWLDDSSWGNTILFAIPLFFGILTKYTFALFLIPMFFIFPLNHLAQKGKWPLYCFTMVVTALSFWWLFYSSDMLGYIGRQLAPDKLLVLLDSNFWKIMLSYGKDNYTLIGMLFALIGLVAFGSLYTKHQHIIGYRFMLYYLLGSALWFAVVSYKLKGHSYHQYPIAPLIAFLIAYGFVFIGKLMENFFDAKGLRLPLALLLVVILLVPSIEARDRMFDTQFYGLDIAGNYVKANKRQGETIMHSKHQAFGLLWHADIKGTRGIPKTLDRIKFAERRRNARWIFIYRWDFGIIRDKERWSYIEENYQIKQVAFMNPKDPVILYLLLRKGGTFSINKIKERLAETPKQTRNYELTKTNVAVVYANFD